MHRVERIAGGRHVIGWRDAPEVVVAVRLVEAGWILRGPRLVEPDAVDADGVGRLANDGPAPLEQVRHQQEQAAEPGEQENSRNDVGGHTARECPTANVGAYIRPLRRQGELGRAEKHERDHRGAHNHEVQQRVQMDRPE